MRKSANRKIRPIRAPVLPLTENHQADLALALHTATASLKTVSGCNNFARILAVFTSAMDIEGKIDDHARNLIRTACLMLEKVTDTGVVDEKTHKYCKALAVWIDRWISQGRITYASLTEAKKIESKLIG